MLPLTVWVNAAVCYNSKDWFAILASALVHMGTRLLF